MLLVNKACIVGACLCLLLASFAIRKEGGGGEEGTMLNGEPPPQSSSSFFFNLIHLLQWPLVGVALLFSVVSRCMLLFDGYFDSFGI
jgi:hypothetical protein